MLRVNRSIDEKLLTCIDHRAGELGEGRGDFLSATTRARLAL